ncbi:ATP synthase F1 subunit delta [Mycoplasma sp. E35C]|uniref:ATP synthase F1 subunit delta n=1 Tax=Mycoplasma sp. E35C TaxID=2801918 RepID=UPI001CA42B25|nr:ATP synthase F1 subunit delta [Mycoplasma sp. E35C]QZX49389.1 F0F1 ATP synthase subunit delta [Mycoplasma sp. E35C]
MDTNVIGFARALVDLAHEENKVQDFYEDLRIVFNLIKTDTDLMSLMNNKVLSKTEKHEIIDIVFKDKLNKTIINFLKVIIDNHEFFNISTIIRKFFRLIEEENHTIFIKVSSAVELNQTQQEELTQKLRKKFNSKLNILFEVNPDLIAGVRIQSNDLLIDNTIDGKLKLLKNRLKSLTKES